MFEKEINIQSLDSFTDPPLCVDPVYFEDTSGDIYFVYDEGLWFCPDGHNAEDAVLLSKSYCHVPEQPDDDSMIYLVNVDIQWSFRND